MAMNDHAFGVATGAAASFPRRQSLLGGVGLAAALTRLSVASADKKSKKKCKKQKKQCRQGVQSFCAQQEGKEVQLCLDELEQCCQSCNVKAGVLCTIGVFSIR
jgi:hypothetical protein